jgi:hypothetical protein
LGGLGPAERGSVPDRVFNIKAHAASDEHVESFHGKLRDECLNTAPWL